MLPFRHSPFLVAAKAHLRRTAESVTVIGFYAQPLSKKKAFKELMLFVDLMRQRAPKDYLVIAGDFNNFLDKMKTFCQEHNSLSASQPLHP